eukprot:CAMPEP_0170824782 /NCGR_PEP_ID=MMETSP0733-20121128/45523_1 /TAXON_ID=186038 /ORGANISM="Fragilariopsis kerguelensis, Strain L26-C5" /LENGTH=219 /DNA_ID=CAMNT_0011188125 /DNA_START=49 /DNA_END=711 /DNA_ORIENTATION=-
MTKREHEMTIEGGDGGKNLEEEHATPKNKKGQTMITPPKKKAKKHGAVKFEKKLLAIPHPQLCAVLATFLGDDADLQARFIASLPAVDVTILTVKLEKASYAISKALPNSRYGSSCDHYGYKRAASAVTAFKKLWNEHVVSLVNGDKDAFVRYSSDAVLLLTEAVDFDDGKDNIYKQLCAKKMTTALAKILKAKDLEEETRKTAGDLFSTLAEYESRRY